MLDTAVISSRGVTFSFSAAMITDHGGDDCCQPGSSSPSSFAAVSGLELRQSSRAAEHLKLISF